MFVLEVRFVNGLNFDNSSAGINSDSEFDGDNGLGDNIGTNKDFLNSIRQASSGEDDLSGLEQELDSVGEAMNARRNLPVGTSPEAQGAFLKGLIGKVGDIAVRAVNSMKQALSSKVASILGKAKGLKDLISTAIATETNRDKANDDRDKKGFELAKPANG